MSTVVDLKTMTDLELIEFQRENYELLMNVQNNLRVLHAEIERRKQSNPNGDKP